MFWGIFPFDFRCLSVVIWRHLSSNENAISCQMKQTNGENVELFHTCTLNLVCNGGHDVLPGFPQFMRGGGACITACACSSTSLQEFSNINPFLAHTRTVTAQHQLLGGKIHVDNSRLLQSCYPRRHSENQLVFQPDHHAFLPSSNGV